MSVLVPSLINRALIKLKDPAALRTKRPEMLQFFNEVQNEIAVTLRCLEDDYYFDLEANQEAYSYPIDRVQIKAMRSTQVSTPTTIGDYYFLDEMFEEDFRAATNRIRPAAYIHSYFARASWFELINKPAQDTPRGGIITAFRIPVWLELETATATMELPDFGQVIVQHGMEILARIGGRERAEANDDWNKWKAEMMEEESKFCDPSVDRRASVRPNMPRRWGHR